MNHFLKVPLTSIISLSAEMAITLLRQVFRSECAYAKICPSALSISSRLNTADGGIDAEIHTADHAEIPSDCLFRSGLTGFQIKTGSAFKPWTASAMQAELFNQSGKMVSEVQYLLERNGRYVVICTGLDLTPKQRNDARKVIAKIFSTQGFSGYEEKIDILGASQIAEFIERYPGTASLLTPDLIQEAWTINEWQLDAHLSNDFEVSEEQVTLINEIRSALSGAQKHLRILGEPGLGKTRIVLEAFKEENLAPFVLYFQNGSLFEQSSFFRQLIKFAYDKPLVIIIDELPEREMIDIWRNLKRRCDSLKMITLDHGRDETSDEEILRLHAPVLTDATIKKILARRIADSKELDRWVSICEGSPRVAQAVADNLFANPKDLLKPPSTIDIWTRFLHGYRKIEGQTARQIDCVAHHLALFSRFGFEAPVGDESEYIARLIQKVDPSVGWAQFQEIIGDLRARRVLQGHRTIFFVPKALHIYLWKQFWERYGRGFNFSQVFSEMPETLHFWFLKMFKYADASENATIVENILQIDGIFSQSTSIMSSKGSQFLSTLAEAHPSAVLRLLEATLAKWSDQALLDFKEHRQHLVWVIEKIAVWEKYTLRSIVLLTKLAINENANNSNNATGTLINLFRIGPKAANTEASPQTRLPAILSLLRSTNDRERNLGLQAMHAALVTNALGYRIIGVENQGTKESAILWTPTTYNDWWEAKLLYFQHLIKETSDWDASLRAEVCMALLEAVEQLITLPPCTELAFQVLSELIKEKSLQPSKLNSIFSWWRDYGDESHSDIKKKLRSLERSLTIQSVYTRFQRYVIDIDYVEWDKDFRKKNGKPRRRSKELVRALARRIANDENSVTLICNLLANSKHSIGLFYFGEQLASNDPCFDFLETLIQIALRSNQQSCLKAYLSNVRSRDIERYYATLKQLLSDQNTAPLGASITLGESYDGALFEQCIYVLNNEWVNPLIFSQLRYGKKLESIPSVHLNQILQLLSKYDASDIQLLLLELLEDLNFDNNSIFNADFVFEAATKKIPYGNMDGYHWTNVCLKLIAWDDKKIPSLLDAILMRMKDDYQLSYARSVQDLTNELVKRHPSQAWEIIKRHIEDSLPKWRVDILHWLKSADYSFGGDANSGAIQYLPVDEIFAWISIVPEERSALIAHAAPNTLDDEHGGQITRELISKYGQYEGVKSGISATMHSGGWVGLESMYHKKKRDKFRHWLASDFAPEVLQWIEEEIEYLDKRIVESEIKEERSHYD